MDFKKGHTGDSVYFQIDVPYDVCTGKDKSKNRIVEMHNHLKTLDKKVNITYKSWGSEKIADYFYIQEVQVNKRKLLRLRNERTQTLTDLTLYSLHQPGNRTFVRAGRTIILRRHSEEHATRQERIPNMHVFSGILLLQVLTS